MKYLTTILFACKLFGFDVQTIDETKKGKEKALELQIQKEELSKLYGNSEFTIAKDNKKIYKPISTVIKPTVNIIKPKFTIIKPTINVIQALQ